MLKSILPTLGHCLKKGMPVNILFKLLIRYLRKVKWFGKHESECSSYYSNLLLLDSVFADMVLEKKFQIKILNYAIQFIINNVDSSELRPIHTYNAVVKADKLGVIFFVTTIDGLFQINCAPCSLCVASVKYVNTKTSKATKLLYKEGTSLYQIQ